MKLTFMLDRLCVYILASSLTCESSSSLKVPWVPSNVDKLGLAMDKPVSNLRGVRYACGLLFEHVPMPRWQAAVHAT